MKKFKILALVMACLMLVSVFAACGENGDGKESKKPDETTKPVAELADLEPKNYDGHEFTVLWPEDNGDGHWIHNEIDCDDQKSADNVDKVVYARNLKVEGDYNIGITSIVEWCTTIPDRIRNDRVSDVPEFDAFFTSTGTNTKLRTITIEGMLADWNDAEYYNEDMSWWKHQLMQEYSFGGALYYAFGDIIYSDDFYQYIIYYNTDLLSRYNIEDNFAELVENKQWTIDKLIELCEGVSSSEDDVWDENDTYGCLVSDTVVRALYYGFGKDVTVLDEDGYPEWVMTPSVVATVAPKIRDFFWQDNICGNTNQFSRAKGGKDEHAQMSLQMFANNQGLFSVAEIIFAERLAKQVEEEVNYRILPMPLYDTKQDDYICVLNDITVLAIPENQDLSRTSHILSALSRESVKTLTPTFFELVLKSKYLPDDASAKMLTKITTEWVKAQDIATRFKYGNDMFGKFINMISRNGEVNFAEIYDANIDTAEAELEELRTLLEYNQGKLS